MISHRSRLLLILLAIHVDILAIAALRWGLAPELVESIRPELEASLAALLLVLLPAGADAALVERARRDPTRSGLADDVVDPVELTRTQQRAAREQRDRDDDDTPSMRPPRPPPIGLQALALVVLAASLAVASSGCGTSSLHAHTETLAIVTTAHAEAARVATAAHERDLAAAQSTADVNEVSARYAPIVVAIDTARGSLLTYAASLAAAISGAAGEAWELAAAAAVARAVLAYQGLAEGLRGLGVEAPTLPEAVMALARLAASIGGAR